MRKLVLALGLFTSIGVAACTREGPVATAPMGGPEATPGKKTPLPVEGPPEPTPAPVTDDEDAPPLRRRLGRACDEEKANGIPACGRSGRVSLATMTRAARVGLPCKGSAVTPQGPYATSACVEGRELWVTSVCLVCRAIDSGWTIAAWIPDLTKDQSRELGKRMQLDVDGATLETVDAWQGALASAAERSKNGQAPWP